MQRRELGELLGELNISAIGPGGATVTPFYGEPESRMLGLPTEATPEAKRLHEGRALLIGRGRSHVVEEQALIPAAPE